MEQILINAAPESFEITKAKEGGYYITVRNFREVTVAFAGNIEDCLFYIHNQMEPEKPEEPMKLTINGIDYFKGLSDKK